MDYFAYYKVKIIGMQYTRDVLKKGTRDPTAVFAVLQLYGITPIRFSFPGQFLENTAVQTIRFHCC